MNNEKPSIMKRFGAYLIDIIIVSLLAGVIASTFTDMTKYENVMNEIKEVSKKYNDAVKELNEFKEKKEEKELEEEYTIKYNDKEKEVKEYLDRYYELNYESVESSMIVTIITLVLTIVYFVIMCYFCHGITLGKSLMKIRIISANGKKLNILNYLTRSLIVNSVLSSLAIIIMFYSLSKNDYINIENRVSSVFALLLIITLIILMYRKDGRGLHDLMANTKVVNIDYKPDEEKDIEDAKIITEKEVDNKEEKDIKKIETKKNNIKKKVGK